MNIDLHVHTTASDGIETPERMVARAAAIGLDGIAITDHDTISGWERAIDAGRRLGIFVIPGKEMRIRVGKKVVGEILALFLNEDIKLNQLSDIGEIIDLIRSQDGIVAIPHPFDWLRKSILIEKLERKGIRVDAVEVLNARNRRESITKSIEYAKRHGYPGIGGSDAHCAKELGSAYTFCNTDDIEEFRKMIKKGKAIPMGSPLPLFEVMADRIFCRISRIFSSE